MADMGRKADALPTFARTDQSSAGLSADLRSDDLKAQQSDRDNDTDDDRKYKRHSGLAKIRGEHPAPERQPSDKP